MNNNNDDQLRPGIWCRAMAIGIALPVICVWGAIGLGLAVFVVLWLTGVILDVKYFDQKKKESDRRSAQFSAELNAKIEKAQQEYDQRMAEINAKLGKAKMPVKADNDQQRNVQGFTKNSNSEHIRYCSQCGNKLSPDSRYCSYCGHKL